MFVFNFVELDKHRIRKHPNDNLMMSQAAGSNYDQHQLRVTSNSWDKTRVENENIKSDKCNFIITRVRTLHTEGGVVKF